MMQIQRIREQLIRELLKQGDDFFIGSNRRDGLAGRTAELDEVCCGFEMFETEPKFRGLRLGSAGGFARSSGFRGLLFFPTA